MKLVSTMLLLVFLLSNIYTVFSLSTEMRIAIVTGANKGIGKAIAKSLASSGTFTQVICACRDEGRGLAAIQDIQKEANYECNVIYLPLTIGDISSHEHFYKEILDRFGKCDVLVNNAGMAFKNADPTPFKQQCKPTLDVNFRGTASFTDLMMPLLRKGNDARLVNVASMSGYLSQLRSKDLQEKFSSKNVSKEEIHSLVDKFEQDVMRGTHVFSWGNSNYGLSKLALIAMTKVWAREERRNGIAVNCCCPGYCDTDMTSHKGPRSPEEGAKNAVIPCLMKDPPSGQFFSNFEVAEW